MMDFVLAPLEAVRDFMELGGDVLTLIALTIFTMWVLIAERLIYFRTGLSKMSKEIHENWEGRPERRSWNARHIREAMISRYAMAANIGVPVIQTLVALCPLLGLMGTVTGMIEVFDVMAISGSGNARSMASGVSKATIPTMAGMVGALSGVFLITMITRSIETRVETLEDDLTMDH
jgi:biopolymer transport protein ExbB